MGRRVLVWIGLGAVTDHLEVMLREGSSNSVAVRQRPRPAPVGEILLEAALLLLPPPPLLPAQHFEPCRYL